MGGSWSLGDFHKIRAVCGLLSPYFRAFPSTRTRRKAFEGRKSLLLGVGLMTAETKAGRALHSKEVGGAQLYTLRVLTRHAGRRGEDESELRTCKTTSTVEDGPKVLVAALLPRGLPPLIACVFSVHEPKEGRARAGFLAHPGCRSPCR